ncbi:sugar phosphate isomerase/epimerase family protein [Rhizorhabdus dicambivorans]|uniref:Sugar phosphate isomerase/epimerase n=1 Tax=Rhizorhabdus dicambivorans TaxID=1850238 RepID=A0A2A4FVM9_9SPHN|nr:sugar phosphate isomerase/epimerase [Rhizorhabdus dicambivorans]ATE66219.1 sugar phosphate isomerase/epimerase [Rhizorhabdus dicambivorans]PCE41732.1 sugar phosphate isomerase/epimerase [Rhizorhabdus dicambivorans]
MQFALAPETLTGIGPAEFLRVAAQVGFRHAGLRVIEGQGALDAPALVRSPTTIADVRRILDGEGLVISELEWVGLDGATDIAALGAGLEIGAGFGARHLCAVVTDSDPARAVDRFAALCEFAAEFGLIVDVEFVPFTAIRTIDEAADLVARSGAGNAGIMFDIIHHLRGGGDRAAMVRHRALVRQVQLCDAPAQAPQAKGDRIRETLQHRLLPGEGGGDVIGALAALRPEVPISIEAPNHARLAAEGAVAYARRAREAAERILARAAHLQSDA